MLGPRRSLAHPDFYFLSPPSAKLFSYSVLARLQEELNTRGAALLSVRTTWSGKPDRQGWPLEKMRHQRIIFILLGNCVRSRVAQCGLLPQCTAP